MKFKNYRVLLLLLLLPVFFSCKHEKASDSSKMEVDTTNKLKYATGFKIQDNITYKKITLINPWEQTEILRDYILYKDDAAELPPEGIKIKIPLQSIAISSVTHIEFLNLLEQLNSIAAVCNPELIYNDELRNRVNDGVVENLGDAFLVNVEKTMLLQPGGLVMSGFNVTDTHIQRIEQTGIPVIYNNEWMEETPLGRAEWIKFMACFFDQEKQADSIFNAIETRYKAMTSIVQNIKNKPTIMSGNIFRGTWYMPSGKNYIARLYKDAGASYFYENDDTAGSLPLNFEQVMEHFSETEYWLNCNYSSLDELVKDDRKHALFNPYKQNRVYSFNKRKRDGGANDFWESSVAQPDLLLADVISILHPELLPDHLLVYAEKLQP